MSARTHDIVEIGAAVLAVATALGAFALVHNLLVPIGGCLVAGALAGGRRRSWIVAGAIPAIAILIMGLISFRALPADRLELKDIVISPAFSTAAAFAIGACGCAVRGALARSAAVSREEGGFGPPDATR